jgi:hypothetical protein
MPNEKIACPICSLSPHEHPMTAYVTGMVTAIGLVSLVEAGSRGALAELLARVMCPKHFDLVKESTHAVADRLQEGD